MDTENCRNQGKNGCFGALDVRDLPTIKTFDFGLNLGDTDDETKRFEPVSDAAIADMMKKKNAPRTDQSTDFAVNILETF